MEGFEIDFQNRRASRYEIGPIPAPESVLAMWAPYTRHWWEGMAAPDADELMRLLRARDPNESDRQRLSALVLIALATLPEERRLAVTLQVAAKNDGAELLNADATDEQLREARYGKFIRPSAKVMDKVVEMLVERKTMPIDKVVLAIVRLVGSLRAGRDEALFEWLFLEQRVQELFEGKGDLKRWRDVRAVVRLVPDKDGKPRLTLRPVDLGEALMFHAARMIATGTSFRVCEHCNGGFLTGGLGRGKSKKRADARFCSEPCRWAFNNERRRKASK